MRAFTDGNVADPVEQTVPDGVDRHAGKRCILTRVQPQPNAM